MKRKLLRLIPYILCLAVAFYALPPLSGDKSVVIAVLVLAAPLLACLCAVVYGIREGFDGLLPLAAALLFTPTIFLYYNASAWVYIPIYTAVVLLGNGIGRVFHKK